MIINSMAQKEVNSAANLLQMRPFASIVIFFFLLIASSSNALQTTRSSSHGSNVSKNRLVYQFLAPQNAARAALHLPPLVWDSRLARYAQWWANQRRWDCALEHSSGPYGENIFWGGGSGWTPYQAAADWVSERRYYNYWYNSCVGGQECGHYTQVVWRATRRIGCAKVNCFYGQGVFMVCNYDPPGNYIGERPY